MQAIDDHDYAWLQQQRAGIAAMHKDYTHLRAVELARVNTALTVIEASRVALVGAVENMHDTMQDILTRAEAWRDEHAATDEGSPQQAWCARLATLTFDLMTSPPEPVALRPDTEDADRAHFYLREALAAFDTLPRTPEA